MKAVLLSTLLGSAAAGYCDLATPVPGTAFSSRNGFNLYGDNTVGTASGCGSCISGKDDWVTFIPTTTINVALSTDNPGTNFDSKIGLFAGTNCQNLEQLDCDDDGGTGLTSYLEATLIRGVRYYIQFGGFSTNEGIYNFTTFVVPSSGTSTSPDYMYVATVGSTLNAPTSGPDVAGCARLAVGNGRSWFRWNAPSAGLWNITTDLPDTNYDTVVAVWQNDGTTFIGCDDDSGAGTTSTYQLNVATANTDYLIQVGGFGTNEGTFALTAVPATPTPGDACPNAINWDGVLPAIGYTTGKTQGISSCGTSTPTGNQWYSFTAPASGIWTFSTASAATNFDTVLSLWSGCGGEINCVDTPSGTNAACGSASVSDCSVVSTPMSTGMTIQIQIVGGTSGAEGNFTLTATRADVDPTTVVACAAAPPPPPGSGSSASGSVSEEPSSDSGSILSLFW